MIPFLLSHTFSARYHQDALNTVAVVQTHLIHWVGTCDTFFSMWGYQDVWGAVCFKSTQFIASSRSSRRIVTLRFETHGTLWYAVRFKSDYSTLRHATPGATWTQFWNIRRHLKSIKWPAVSKLLLYHHFVRYEEPRPRSAGSFVTKSFETYSTQCHAVCLKICNSALRRQYTPI